MAFQNIGGKVEPNYKNPLQELGTFSKKVANFLSAYCNITQVTSLIIAHSLN